MPNVLEELSPYYFSALGVPNDSWLAWKSVLDILRRYELTGIPQPELPRSIQRPGALLGLTIGLCIRQASEPAAGTSRSDDPERRPGERAEIDEPGERAEIDEPGERSSVRQAALVAPTIR